MDPCDEPIKLVVGTHFQTFPMSSRGPPRVRQPFCLPVGQTGITLGAFQTQMLRLASEIIERESECDLKVILHPDVLPGLITYPSLFQCGWRCLGSGPRS
jgi:hypothetical protein